MIPFLAMPNPHFFLFWSVILMIPFLTKVSVILVCNLMINFLPTTNSQIFRIFWSAIPFLQKPNPLFLYILVRNSDDPFFDKCFGYFGPQSDERFFPNAKFTNFLYILVRNPDDPFSSKAKSTNFWPVLKSFSTFLNIR